MMISFWFSKSGTSEQTMFSGISGYRFGAVDVRTVVGIREVSAMATGQYSHKPQIPSKDHTSLNQGIQAFDYQYIFDRNNTAGTGQNSARLQGAIMKIVKRGAAYGAVSHKGYIPINEELEKARCK